ncbi:hypothetical protein Csa_023944, partial [Cucumis sativus]
NTKGREQRQFIPRISSRRDFKTRSSKKTYRQVSEGSVAFPRQSNRTGTMSQSRQESRASN